MYVFVLQFVSVNRCVKKSSLILVAWKCWKGSDLSSHTMCCTLSKHFYDLLILSKMKVVLANTFPVLFFLLPMKYIPSYLSIVFFVCLFLSSILFPTLDEFNFIQENVVVYIKLSSAYPLYLIEKHIRSKH